MKKVKILLAALGVALMAMFALAPAAQAQTLASVTADPLFVAAGGEQTFTITAIIVDSDPELGRTGAPTPTQNVPTYD